MPLQKSYSEHIGLSRARFLCMLTPAAVANFNNPQRSPWQRSRSHPVHQSNPRPLQPVSDVTKNKLSKFQYKPAQNDPSKDATADEKEAADDDVIPSKDDDEKTATTPMNRLTWKDFMEPSGATEEETHISPNERIMWDSKPDTLYANALSPMLARRGRKRARSSSPISSPAADNPKTPAVNVKKLAQALKSPHADPTLELWDRYSLSKNETHTTPVGLANPALAQLMISSSPRPSKDSAGNHSSGNLRRAVSYGLNGPKRRKIEKTKSCGSGSNSQREMEAASKSSLVTQLLDSVNSSIQEPSPEEPKQLIPESPSPRKKRRSPLKDSTPCRAGIGSKAPDILSDYGDEDFDDDTFMELEASINGPRSVDPADPAKDGIEGGGSQAHIGRNAAVADEFGDFDDGDFDAANLTTVTRAKPSADTGQPVSPAAATISRADDVTDDFDDEFGDLDNGDIDFDAVELAATQSVKRAQTSTQSVRWQGSPR